MLADAIWVLHCLFVLWVVITPFTNDEFMLALHFVVVPCVWFHWLTTNACVLSLAESRLRGLPTDQTFFGRLVEPVYDVSKTDVAAACWIISLGLWLVTASKVYKNPTTFKAVFLGRS